MKKTSVPNPVKILGYIKCYSLSSPELFKVLTILSDTTLRRYAVEREYLKPYWRSEKGQISEGDEQAYYFQRIH